MTDSRSIHAILAAVQSKWSDPKRTSKGQVGRQQYMYASIENVLGLVREHLAPRGVALVQSPTTRTADDRTELVVDTVLVGPAGDRIEHSMAIPFHAGATPQQVGSAITYARRYSLLALLGLGQEDDDGAAASAAKPPPAAPAPKKKQPEPKQPVPEDDGYGKWMKARSGSGFNLSVPSGSAPGDTVEVRRKDGGIQDLVITKRVGRAFGGREEWTWEMPPDPDPDPEP